MSKLSIGKGRIREKENTKSQNSKEANLFFVIGCVLISLMIIPSVDTARYDYSAKETAVPVFSSAVGEVGEMNQSTEEASAESKEWSVYDYIGQMFAELLFGER